MDWQALDRAAFPWVLGGVAVLILVGVIWYFASRYFEARYDREFMSNDEVGFKRELRSHARVFRMESRYADWKEASGEEAKRIADRLAEYTEGPYIQRAASEPDDKELSAGKQEVAQPETAKTELQKIKEAAGRLLYQIPRRMTLAKFCQAEVRIGMDSELRAAASIHTGWQSDELPTKIPISVVDRMSVSLRGEPEAFLIESTSERMQYIGAAPLAAAAFQKREYGRWLFQIKPLKSGTRRLYITVAGVIGGGSNGGAPRELEEEEYPVEVRIGIMTIFGFATLRIWALIGVLFAATVGVALQDLWWPDLKRALGIERSDPPKPAASETDSPGP